MYLLILLNAPVLPSALGPLQNTQLFSISRAKNVDFLRQICLYPTAVSKVSAKRLTQPSPTTLNSNKRQIQRDYNKQLLIPDNVTPQGRNLHV